MHADLAQPLPIVWWPDAAIGELRLSEPLDVTLPHSMKTKKKPLDVVKPCRLGADVAPRAAVPLRVSSL